MIEDANDLDKWYAQADPWNYESNPDDLKRREILLSEIRGLKYQSVLDIGCGNGFITESIPGSDVLGVDISPKAIEHAQRNSKRSEVIFRAGNIFDIEEIAGGRQFDLVVITGVLYPQYIGKATSVIYRQMDRVLRDGGHLICVHIDEWYRCRFPYLLTKQIYYDYREYNHYLEVYLK